VLERECINCGEFTDVKGFAPLCDNCIERYTDQESYDQEMSDRKGDEI